MMVLPSTIQTSSDNYDDLVNNPNFFSDKLRGLSNCLDVPIIGGNSLDVHRLFIEVTSRGGFDRVTKDRKWKEVSRVLNIPTTITSASSLLKKYYLRFLHQMERVYFVPKPASPPLQSTVMPDHGVINGEVDNGYIMTLKMGSNELNGVFYYGPRTPIQFQEPMETPSGIVPPSAGIDSQTPKCYRKGYNFFFAEQYAKLKHEHHGKGPIPKKIGHMWSNLPISEKQVYEDKGLKDVEPYRMQMLEFKSPHVSGAASSSGAI